MDLDPFIGGDATRRQFLRRAAAFSVGFGGLSALMSRAALAQSAAGASPWQGDLRGAYFGPVSADLYGPLKKDPDGILDLPEGFSYRVLSRMGDEMDDGLLMPGKPDAMCVFPRPDGTLALVCNHEIESAYGPIGAFGKDQERLDKVPEGALYDRGSGVADGKEKTPQMGGVTITIYDPATKSIKRRFLALAGTTRNCAGGPTPWGSWLSCEETVYKAGKDHPDGTCGKDHGYVFEVPSTTDSIIVNPQPLKAMGRFYREAVCVDPATGIVYQTEDRPDGVFTRFVPKTPGKLGEGGKLQVLTIKDVPRARDGGPDGGVCTRNWGDGPTIRRGHALEVGWMDVDDPENPDDKMRSEQFARGAARFARGEGMWWAGGSAYFCCTNGGAVRLGQIWKYTPSKHEGTSGEAADGAGGRLELFIESQYPTVCRNPDNITAAPWGDLIVCEDNSNSRLLGVLPDGRVYHLAHNAKDGTELAGACFTPDGDTLLVNLQHPGLTLAIEGPWKKGGE